MVRRSGQQGVPVIVVDGEVIVGFDRPRLEAVLARARARPSLGVRVAKAEAIARQERRKLPAGALVGQVTPGSPAERAGLRPGDVILSVDGIAVHGPDDLQRVLAGLSVGRTVPIAWWRKGQQVHGTLDL